MAAGFGAALGNNGTFDAGTPTTSRGFSHSGVPAGDGNNWVVVCAVWYADSNGATYSSLSGGLTWIELHHATPHSDANFHIGAWAANAPSGLSAGTITITLTANAYGLNVGGVYATGASGEDGTSAASYHSADTGVWGSTVTGVSADSIVFGFGTREGGETTSTPDTNYTEALDWAPAGSGNTQSVVYRAVASGGSYTPGGTFAATSTSKMSIAVALAAGGGEVWPPVDNPAAPPLRLARSNLRIG